MTKEYDLVVLGGGTGGYVAAIRASQLGMKVALVESNKLGGTCLHQGCIPTKALLRTAELYRHIRAAHEFGIGVSPVTINFEQVQTRKDNIVTTLHEGVKTLLKKNNVVVYHGYGRILGPSIFSPLPGTISIEYDTGEENTLLVPKYVLLATGSKPRSLSGLEVDGQYILSSDEALQLETLPKSMLIVGGGVIGIEWASLLHDLGVQVTIVENAEQILLTEDHEIRLEVERQLKKRGIQIITGATLLRDTLEKSAEHVKIDVQTASGRETIKVEKILVSVGREPNTAEIGLQNTSIQIENGFILTNDRYQTKESHIYAIGDCIGGMQLAHVASAEGIIAVEHMAGKTPEPMNPLHIPSAIYAHPEVAKIGLSEKAAKEKGYAIKIGKFPFQAIGKAHVEGDNNGFVKMIINEETDDILGVHLVGTKATELISEASLAVMLNATAWEIAKTIHPHPSLAEIFPETALATDNLQIHG